MSETQKLLEATERNTHAVRAIAIYLIGFIFWMLISAGVITVGFILLPIDNTLGLSVSVIGLGVLLFGAVQVISKSTSELKASEKPQSPKAS